MNKPSAFSLLHKNFNIDLFIRQALKEDISTGDHTSLSTISATARNKACLIIKENGILAGTELAKRIFHIVDKNLKVTVYKNDGSQIKKGEIAFSVEGSARSILTAERVVLNCLQRMSGIATMTNKFVNLCKPYKTKLLDTRKTTPLVRGLEKWAVKIGGGYNHRFGLYDMILIKNNHIDFAGGISNAIESANDYLKKKRLKLQIEIEARDLKEVKEILSIGKITRILLDNFSVSEIKKAVQLINGKFETEISGGVNKKNIRQYASCGSDYISVGALTHSVKALDMSLTAM
ncbi:MAG: carboxylating nicotinate-nucleotide diphosphorylase [Bacteroidetes bacterium]|nr:carboxylating nicotinate-nucleotide diphosphorylase [Bacteroidota bacterium]